MDTLPQFEILGPLQVRSPDGKAVAIAGARERALLTRLLLDAGRTVSDQRLLDDLWPAGAGSARKSLQVRVSNLRRQLADVVEIRRVGNGYQVVADPESVDALRFEDALAQAAELAPSDAVPVLDRALDAWTPAALQDLRDTPAADLRDRLARMARDARRRLGSALVESGHPARGVRLLADLADRHPDDESVASALVRGLYADGRAAEALAAHRRTVDALASDGLDPTPAFLALATSVLRHELDVPTKPGDAHAHPPATGPAPTTPGPSPTAASSDTTLHAPHVSLPVVSTPFLGRRAAVAAAVHALTEDRVRLLTLWGPGGVGKTRLAFEVARRVEDDFPEPHVVVDGARLDDPDDLPAALVRAAGLPERGSPLDVLAAGFAVRDVLVLVDNVEHLLGGTDVLTRLLAAGDGVQVLVTSRVVLNVRPERVQPVEPLGGVAAEGEVTAVDFLRRRAHDMGATQDEDFEVLARIAQRLDGLPLALELAAARLRGMPAARLEADLGTRLGALGVLHDLPDRQRTLHATVDWSASLLDDQARDLLVALGVFAGPARIDAIVAVRPDADLDALLVLVDHALLRRVPTEDGDDTFMLLETVRRWAEEQLTAVTWADDARHRHARHHAAEAAVAAEALETSGQSTATRHLAAIEPDIERALRTLHAAGQDHALCRLVLDLWRWWFGIGATRTAERWLQVGASTTCDCPDRVRVWSHLAFVRSMLGDAEGARAALAAAERIDIDDPAPPELDVGRWIVAYQDDDLVTALGAAGRAARTYRDQGRAVRAAEMQVRAALVSVAVGDLDEAERANREALAVMVAHGPRWEEASVHNNLAHFALERGDTTTALAEASAGVAIFDRLPFARDHSVALETLLSIHVARGELDQARRAGTLALEEARRVGDEESAQRVRIALADIELDEARPDEAAKILLGHPLATFSATVHWHLLAVCTRLLAMAGDDHGADAASLLAREAAPDPASPAGRLAAVVERRVAAIEATSQAGTPVAADLAGLATRVHLVAGASVVDSVGTPQDPAAGLRRR